nr:winged helix-turn-helix domain-containing protein [Rubrobacteraceae bacterium]
DVHVANLRKKLDTAEKGAGSRYIQTVRGVGYKFEGP